MIGMALKRHPSPPDSAHLLSDNTLLEAMADLPTASVLVTGKRARWAARSLLRQDEFSRLKLHVDEDRDADAWELF